MKIAILFLLLTMLQLISVESKAQEKSDDSIYFKIDFQDFFSNDKASLQINNYYVFRNVILISEKSAGVTNTWVTANTVSKKKNLN